MNEQERLEYETTAECFRHNQGLIHQGISSYIALAAPLAAVSLASNLEQSIRSLAAFTGFFTSVLWVLISSRLMIYNHHHFKRLVLLEGRTPGFAAKDVELKELVPWLKKLPGTTYTILITYAFCGSLFLGFATYIIFR
ncbi:hypothetical protein PQU92_04165 [Asticcacaulis sp. BYS171W]|uniref:Uncharacterized protein n=1 Tax=Asticcacaulis aquaticus TaxID=2984212 RepID=A0ABT5HQW6_9CAUL|nr:hypothetical protein [Asticcacaulis aquaticus]MDC7682456.1 hypothetical protein [Asticcacaulis aquaticus]